MQTKKKKKEKTLYFFILCYLLVFPSPPTASCCSAQKKTKAQFGEKLKTFWKKIGIEITEDNNIAEVQMNIS